MESVSKKKRGRPSVYFKRYGNDDMMKEAFSQMNNNESTRSQTNNIYYMNAFTMLNRHLGEDKFKEIFFTPVTKKAKWQSILIEIGRMSLQNNFSEESCTQIADTAIQLLEKGFTVKAVESWIRRGRNTNQWE